MSEEWIEVSLSEVFTLDNAKLGKHSSEPRVLSLSKYDGFVPSDEYFDKRIASANLDGYKVVDPHGWAYSTIHIDEGSIARNTLGFTGVISPMYTTMRWSSDAHCAAYFAYLLKSPAMLSAYQDSAQGTVNRRRSLAFKTFSSLKVTVPPLPVQRRIVDLMTHVDSHLANLRAEQEAAKHLLESARKGFLLDVSSSNTVRLGLCVDSLDSQRRPVKSSDRQPGPFPYYGASGIVDYVDRWIFEGEAILVSEDGANLRARSTPIAFRASGRYWVNNHAHVIRARSGHCNAFLAHVLESLDITLALTGTTMPKLNAANLLALEIPLVDLGEQRTLGELWDAMESNVDAISKELLDLENLRSRLIQSLVSGSLLLPEHYDSLCAEVA